MSKECFKHCPNVLNCMAGYGSMGTNDPNMRAPITEVAVEQAHHVMEQAELCTNGPVTRLENRTRIVPRIQSFLGRLPTYEVKVYACSRQAQTAPVTEAS